MSSIGLITLIGSGETSPSAHRIFSPIFEQLQTPVNVAILETPAGFEPNSDAVAGAVGAYLAHHLQNFRPRIEIVPARRRGSDCSTESAEIASPLLHADFLFMGPGSPTYAARHLMKSYVWHAMLARHRLGAAICFSSASTISVSRHALPVYEIYKVGEELHWQAGLDFFAAFGLKLTIVPHWNNNDGGVSLDTSRCYMGSARYDRLIEMLPGDDTILGIDENTGLVISPVDGNCQVLGPGGVVIVNQDDELRFEAGSHFPATLLGEWRLPESGDELPESVWAAALDAQGAIEADQEPSIPDSVAALAAARAASRAERDWSLADQLRDQMLALGWQVNDTADGQQLEQR